MHGATLTLKEMPPYLPKAFLAIEDRRFYSHFGIDPIGLVRAAVANLSRRGVSQGGSTITQQLAKNLFLTQERTFARKLQELVLALWLERKFSKTEILELYLNRVYFGAGAYGVDAAAQRYFGKSARHVTIAEAAMLAGLVRSPSRLAPNRNPDGAERRAQVVLAAMSEHGFITETMAKLALAQPARAVKVAGNGSANYVADWIMDVLDDLVGRVEQDLVVGTSIDPALQAAAEAALVDELAQKGEKFGVSQGAIVAMTPDGAVRALVGGKNYAESQFNRAVAAKRQPGSAFKPFVYLTALERGLTPETVREDKPIAIKGWRPENYSREYYGAGHADAGARAFAQHGLGAADPGVRPDRRGPHRLSPRHRLQARGQSLARARHLRGFADRAGLGLCAVRQRRQRDRALCRRARAAPRPARSLYQRSPHDLGRIIEPRYVAMMNAMMRETMRVGTATQGPVAGMAGGRQDRHQPGFPRRLVRRLHRPSRHRRLARQRRFLADPAGDRRRPAGRIWARFMRGAHQGVAGRRPARPVGGADAGVDRAAGRQRPAARQCAAISGAAATAAAERQPRRMADRPAVRPALSARR